MSFWRSKTVIACVVAMGFFESVLAQNDNILIGMSLPLSGPNAAAGQEGLTVAKAAVAALNAEGGIQGRKVTIVALDDEFNPSKAVENAKALDSQGVLAIFNCWGTASCSAMMPTISEKRIPMISGIAGGGSMRTDPGRFAFNVRPSTSDELTKIVTQMQTIGQNRIAVIYQDDPFGKSGLQAAQSVFQKAGLKPTIALAIARDGSNAASIAKQLQESNANSSIVIASPQATVALIVRARRDGLGMQFYNLAAQANPKLLSDLGEHTRGVVFTTLVPSPWKTTLPIVRDYQQAIKVATQNDAFSYLGLEVFINAQVLIEGLKRAGSKVSRDSLVTALETMGEKRFGGVMTVRYGASDRNGSDYVGLAIIGSQGRFVE